MFNWLTKSTVVGSKGLSHMRGEFGQMLDAGRQMFETAANCLLGGTHPDVIRNNLIESDRRINDAVQHIRREIVVHATIGGAKAFSACLILMSIIKDAERIGDYAKNIFELAEMMPESPEGAFCDDLVQLKDQIVALMADCRQAFDTKDEELGRRLMVRSVAMKDHCDEKISQLIRGVQRDDLSTTYALAYRYFKRVIGHSYNVATSIVQPVDKIDFFTSPAIAQDE